MSFRTRLFLAFTLAVLLPLAALAIGARREMDRRLGAEYAREAGAAIEALRDQIGREGAGIAARLAALGAALEADNDFRLAVVQNQPGARRELLDWAGEAMRLSGLSLLELQDSAGRILSSGHFRNEYGRTRAGRARISPAAGEAVTLVRARTASGSILALARADTLAVAGREFTLLGGVPVDRLAQQVAGRVDLAFRMALPSDPPAAAGMTRALTLPFHDLATEATSMDSAHLGVVQSGATLAAVRRGLNAWFIAVLAFSMALGLAAAAWLSSRVSRPLRDLAARTGTIDFDRLDQDFPSDRPDEIGTLSRTLGDMTARLRAGAARLREAERRIAVGDLARQVNHDIKNGLAPIRNVLHHFDEVAREEPAALAGVYGERRATLESSVAYLDTLARNYARLTPATSREPCDVNSIVGDVVRAAPAGPGVVRADTAAELPSVPADRIALRRIVENLVGNAVDSVAAGGGSVVVSTGPGERDGTAGVRITVADTGPGMSRPQLDRAFDDFFTTKDGGTGLGLSIVRRLVLDLGGSLRVDTAPGEGTRVTVELPSAPGGDRA